MVPYDDADPLSEQDAFNFWLSNSRIQIECAFGELIMRWGIFWRTLKLDVKRAGDTVGAAMLLHNFLVARRDNYDRNYFKTFSHQSMESDVTGVLVDDDLYPLVSDNNQPNPGGRPSEALLNNKEKGENLRNYLAWSLGDAEKGRPLTSGMKVNQFGHVYFEY